MNALPCTSHPRLYDLVLFEPDAPAAERAQAVHQAAALCAGCPAPCPEKVTADSGPRELVLLADDWMPSTHEGRPEPKTPAVGKRRGRQPAIPTGRDYVPPAKRPTTWARMAAEYADQGVPLAQIAERLCVTEETAAVLIQQTCRVAA